MPATSIRDLVVHNDDIVVGTHGRSFWILDDITPLRQLTNQIVNAPSHLFAPQVAYRVKRNVNSDTPLPPEEPVGQNPPDGAIINYYLKENATRSIVLEIFDAKNQLVRRYSSDDKPEPINEKDYAVPAYWYRPPQVLQTKAGLQRFIWDLKYAPPPAFSHGFPISAIYKDTPLYPLGPAVLPGTYTVKLTVNDKVSTQTMTVKMDPRVNSGATALGQQFSLSLEANEGMEQSYKTVEAIRRLRTQIKSAIDRVGRGPLAEALAALDKKATAIGGPGSAEAGSPGTPGGTIDLRNPNLTTLNGSQASLLENLQSADLAPTVPTVSAAAELQRTLTKLLADWNDLRTKDLEAVNAQLKAANQQLLVP
jgi:hypothetical protein